MNACRASGCGKVILCGEHAVVHGRPAIAVPVSQVRACASIVPARAGHGLSIDAPDIDVHVALSAAEPDDPLALAARLVLARLGAAEPNAILTLTSTIPIARGLGSGAAVSTAIIRAMASFLGTPLSPTDVSHLAFEVERIYHGTPSGVDTAVIAFEEPMYFVKGLAPVRLELPMPIDLIVADSGQRGETRAAVERVRRRWEADPARCDALFDGIAALVERMRQAILSGDVPSMGPLLDENQELLAALGVSSPALDRLLTAARLGGALGAKLSGAGCGGNMIALASPQCVEPVEAALHAAGALRVIRTRVS